ncbi:9023_t:CDS:10 [Diversispora eburnea]|uniref:Anaphase-promoting complex subunit 4 n=1 Tax=Diversispora eburnea TaxID=1213867 RepID=A0A9N8V420_9GLOM|nr:9023_t:CDS:10 [Diversispora eburnea]
MIFQQKEGNTLHLIKQHVVELPLKVVSMCPTMDLIAVQTISGNIWIARWYNALEKIWTLLPNQEKVEKVIAIGYSNGKIKLYNVDKLELLHELAQKPNETTNLSFIQWVQDTDNNSDDMIFGLQYLPRLNTLPHVQPIRNILDAEGEELEDETSNSIDLLLAGDTLGNLHMSVYGVYNFHPISLSHHLKTKNIKIMKASVTPDLSLITLLIQTIDDQTSVDKSLITGRLLVVTFNTGLLYTRKFEIRILSQRYTAIKYLMDYVFHGVKLIEVEYNNMKRITNKFLDAFQEVLNNHTIKTSLSAEYVRLLATGRPSSMLTEYFESHVTKRGLKDWENKGQKSFKIIREYIHHHVRAGCERLLLELNALVGYSKWPQKFKELGLTESFVHSCLMSTGCLISRLEKLMNVIDEEYINFKEFQQWIQYEILPAYPYDYLSVNKYYRPQTLGSFVNMLMKNCESLYSMTANSVANSVTANEYIDIVSGLIDNNDNNNDDNNDDNNKEFLQKTGKENEFKNILLTDMKIIVENSKIVEYIAFYISDKKRFDLPSSLWVLRFPLNTGNNDKLSESRPVEIAAIQLMNNEYPEDYLSITDLKLFNDEIMHIIIVGSDNKDDENNEVHYLAEINYTNLNFISIPGPQNIEKLNDDLSVVDQVLDKMRSQNLTTIKPSQLTTNGTRDLVCVLSEDRRRVIIYDTNGQEEIDEEKNNEKDDESLVMMEE